MKKLALCALSLLVATSLYGCNSNESQNASVTTTKAQAASLKVVQGKLSKSVFIKVDGKEVVDDNEFKLDAKLDNIYILPFADVKEFVGHISILKERIITIQIYQKDIK